MTFPVALDPSDSYAVSNAYGLTNVPSVFWIAPGRSIEIASVGWVRHDMEDIHRRIAGTAGNLKFPLFKPGDDVRDFRAG